MKLRTALPVLCILFAVLSPEASAQPFNRTAVSLNGDDLNNCAVASPCRSFTRALSQTNPGGEVIALTSGGYGPFTVDKSVTVMAAPGVYAGITASAGDGITVNATATSKVVLRNLFVNGLGLGSAGVAVTGLAAETHIEQLVIDGFVNYGIIAFSDVRISDTTIRNSGSGIWIDNAGAAVQGTIERVLVKDMAGGDPGAPGSGIVVLRNANVTVRNSVATVTTRGILASDNGVLNIENCVATNSNEGISSFGDAIVRISNNVVTNNTVGIISLSQTTIQTWQNNKVAGNGTNIVGGPLTNLAQN